jgi:hypothetical protein
VNDELVRVWKEAAAAQSRHSHGIYVERLRKNTNTEICETGVSNEIRAPHLPGTSLQLYRLEQLSTMSPHPTLTLSIVCAAERRRLALGIESRESPTALPSPRPVPRDQTVLPLFAPLQRQFHLLAISCPVPVSVTYKTNPSVMSLWTPRIHLLWLSTTIMQ